MAMEWLQQPFALAVISAGHHHLLIGARRGARSPSATAMVQCIWAPTPLALAPFTRRICYLEEDDWAAISASDVKISPVAWSSVR